MDFVLKNNNFSNKKTVCFINRWEIFTEKFEKLQKKNVINQK